MNEIRSRTPRLVSTVQALGKFRARNWRWLFIYTEFSLSLSLVLSLPSFQGDGESMILQNARTYLPNQMTSRPRGPYCQSSAFRKKTLQTGYERPTAPAGLVISRTGSNVTRKARKPIITVVFITWKKTKVSCMWSMNPRKTHAPLTSFMVWQWQECHALSSSVWFPWRFSENISLLAK
jgi:hypothetical protein